MDNIYFQWHFYVVPQNVLSEKTNGRNRNVEN